MSVKTKRRSVGYIGNSFYRDIDGKEYEYVLKPTPVEAVYWETYKAKAGDVRIKSGAEDKTEASRVRKEIAASVNEEMHNG